MKIASARFGVLAAMLLGSFSGSLQAQVNVTTFHNDNARTGQNTQETILTPANVTSNTFGKAFTTAVDGWVFAQPLYMANVTISGGVHNVLYVATEHDSLYALDADTGLIYWKVSLIAAGGTTINSINDLNCTDMLPEVGITGTPVIDPATGTIYLVARTKIGSTFVQYLHALSINTGAEKFGGPMSIQATVAGNATDGTGSTVSFGTKSQNQRAGLLLENGHVVIGWASHCDTTPWHGWVMSYNASTLAQEAVYNTSPNGYGNGVWMSAGGIASDANGDLYFATGNGSWNGTTDLGDSIVKLGPPSSGTFPVLDYFTPYNQVSLAQNDLDVASGGLTLLPTLPNGKQLLVVQAKEGKIFLVDQNNMGKYCVNQTPACTNSDPNIVQEVPNASVGVWGVPAYWNGNVYWGGGNDNTGATDNLSAFSFNANGSGLISTTATSRSPQSFGFSAPVPAVSANGTTAGIVWGVDDSTFAYSCNNGVDCQTLYAYDATNLANMLYNSNQAANLRDVPGGAVKYVTPTIANGKVYIGSQYSVSGYGLIAALPTLSPGPGSYGSAQTVTIADSTPGVSIYYTTDGSTPTTNSTKYSGPIQIATSTTLSAMATSSAYAPRVVSGIYYINSTTMTTVSLGSAANVDAIVTDGSAVPNGGIDGQGNAYSATLLGTTATWNGVGFTFGAPSTPDASSSKTITLPAGSYSTLSMLASAVNGSQTGQLFTVTYTDGTTSTYTQSISDWGAPQSYAGESIALTESYRLTPSGAADNRPFYVYGYAFALNSAKTVKSLTLPNNRNVVVLAVELQSGSQSPVAATPTFSPAAGNYASAQTVTIADTTTGAVIYYTTDGSTPTTASAQYSAPLTVSASGTLKALAAASGYTASAVGSATYNIGTVSPTTPINNPGGFTGSAGFSLVGGATLNGSALQLTDGGGTEARAVWFATPVNVQSFTTDFNFQDTSASADGMTFTIQNATAGAKAIGLSGGSLGYQGITPSVAVKFDLYSNSGEGADSTGFYTNGASPMIPAIDMSSSGLNLHSGNPLHAHLTYDGTTLTLTLTDTVTLATFSTATAINIPTTVGSNTAYVGFTAGTGGLTAVQSVLSWTYTTGAPSSAAATPTFSPAGGTYTGAQTVTLSDSTAGASIFYTLDGSTPTASSAKYSAPLTVSATTTINAIATASGLAASAVGSASYTISAPAPAATPTFSPAPGTYTSAQTVTLADSTAGASIFYTVDGSTPTTASAKYSAPLAINATTTVKAVASAAGFTTSAVGSATYTINAPAPAATPTFSPAGGTYTSAQTVTLADSTAGASIFYTLDGSTPTTASAKYSAPLAINATTTVKALASAAGFTASAVGSATYTINIPTPAATPAFNPAGGTYASAQTVTLSDSTAGASIFYTVDGSTPTPSSTKYSAPLTVSATTTLKAVATAAGFTTSAVGSATYTINIPTVTATPSFSPAGGSYTSAQSVSLSDSTAGASIYYTLDGSTPTTSSAKYSTPLAISATTTVKALASASGFTPSAVASATYTVTIGSSSPTPVAFASPNVAAIGKDGVAVPSGGIDGQGYAYSGSALGTTANWGGASFTFGTAGALNAIKNTTVTLPAGNFATLALLATGVNGNQASQVFVVTYTDGTTTRITQSLSDWFSPQSYAGESVALAEPYRLLPSGGADNRTFNVYGYALVIDSTRTVKSLTLPSNGNVVVLAAALLPAKVNPAGANFGAAANVEAIGANGVAVSNGGIDGQGFAYSGTVLGASASWGGNTFTFGSAGALDAISSTTFTLPSGNYSKLALLGTGVSGAQSAQVFYVTYTDGTTTSITQSLSDWFTPQSFTGESIALTEAYRLNPDGSQDNRTFYVYGYSFAIDNTRTVKSFTLPSNRNVVLLSVTLVP